MWWQVFFSMIPSMSPIITLLLVMLVTASSFAQADPTTTTAQSITQHRTIVPFSYGWKFHFGHEPNAEAGSGTCLYDKDVTNSSCTNMEHAPFWPTEQNCARACCYSDTCTTYQYMFKFCYHGGKDSICTPTTPGNYSGGKQRSTIQPIRNNYTYSLKELDSSNWSFVDLPHDGLFVNNNTISQNHSLEYYGFIERNVTWYRKKFLLPADWKSADKNDQDTIFLRFEGAMRAVQIWINGEYIGSHMAGYTGFTVRLDNITSLLYGNKSNNNNIFNVIALRCDASYGSGHWYEGGGLYRDVHLVKTSNTHVVEDGFFVESNNDGTQSVPMSAEVEVLNNINNNINQNNNVKVMATFQLKNKENDELIASSNSSVVTLIRGAAPTILQTKLSIQKRLNLWSTKFADLYVATVKITHITESESQNNETVIQSEAVDTLSVDVGFRQVQWKTTNFQLNDETVELRGFSHHGSFGGLGVALPDRVNLLKVQTTRALGGNFWRMSHNPYRSSLYDLLDATGVMCWDENRNYGPWYTGEMHDMVKRDRNHPSVVVWSFCNEHECVQNDPNRTGFKFRNVTLSIDNTRATANNNNKPFTQLTAGIDVQGLSHNKVRDFQTLHSESPDLPLVLSECCSCTTDNQRAPIRVMGTCMRKENQPMSLPFVSGSMGVWTLFDYYGESKEWPHVTSAFGQMDSAGFPKPHAYWYSTNWLGKVPIDDTGRPPITGTKPIVRIIDLLDMLTSNNNNNYNSNSKGNKVQVTGITSAPRAQLIVDGQPLTIHDSTGMALSWTIPSTIATISNATLVALDNSNNKLAISTVLKPGKADNLKAIVDVPSASTGTGSKLVLDGHDAALLRVTVVDKKGTLVSTEAQNVTFEVVSGPGRVIGANNGDQDLHILQTTTVPTFGGLARGIVQVSEDCTTENVALASHIDIDSGKRTKVSATCEKSDTVIVVRVTSENGWQDEVSIPVTNDLSFAPLAEAAKTRSELEYSYLSDFEG